MEIANLIISGVTALAIVFAVIQIKINKKQLFLSTITKCISDFRNLGELNRQTKNADIINRFIDLTNEELFYFQHKYIPKVIRKEWIDGMIDFIPITNINGQILNKEYCIKYIAENRSILFQNYPRIQNAFELNKTFDFGLIYSTDETKRIERVKERKRLIEEILKKINIFNFFD
jgi:hypothetical protein